MLFYSKLAVIELCGWIELTMDEMVLSCAKKHLANPTNLAFVEKEVIRRNYRFHYDEFREMLMKVVGLVRVEELESRLDTAKFQRLKSTLGILEKTRNGEAHTFIDD